MRTDAPGRAPRRLHRGAALALSGAVLCGVGMGLAQGRTEPPNPALRVDLGFGLQAGDDTATRLRTDLGVGYLARTRTQQIALDLGTAVELGEDGVGRNAFLPAVGTTYAFDNGETELSLSGSYRVRKVDGIAFLLDEDATDFETIETVEDDGRLETLRAGARLALFRRAPVGLELGADVLRRTYRDTADPDLDDTRSTSLDAALRLTPRPGLDFRLTAARSAAEQDGTLESETETTRLGARVTWAATPTTTVDLGLARSQRDETRNAFAISGGALVLTGGRETVTNDGLVWEGGLVQARPNGTRTLGVSRTLTAEGAISTLQLGRALELSGGGQLELGVGVAQFEEGDTVPTLSLSYGTELAPGDDLRVTLSRVATTDGDNQDIARTRARLSYAHALTPVSQLGLTAGLARIDVIDGFDADQTAITLGVGYGRDLTPDWALSARYDHTASRTDGADTARDNRVSLSLGRSFTFRP